MTVGFYLPDLIENKNGRHPDCVEAARKHGTIKNNYLYIEKDKLPSVCGEFKKKDVGKSCVGCGSGPNNTPINDELKENLEKEGIQYGSLIEKMTEFLGIEQCPPCRARKQILNNVKKLGWKEAARQLKETFF